MRFVEIAKDPEMTDPGDCAVDLSNGSNVRNAVVYKVINDKLYAHYARLIYEPEFTYDDWESFFEKEGFEPGYHYDAFRVVYGEPHALSFGDIPKIFDVTRAGVVYWRDRDPDFPKPYLYKSKKYWLRSEIMHWANVSPTMSQWRKDREIARITK